MGTGYEKADRGRDYLMKSRINTNKEEMKRIIYCLSVEMTRRCNMKCDFCARGDAQNVTITKKIIDKTLEEMEGVYINGLRLSGGEPFLAENEIEYLVEEIIRRKIHINHIELFTNGTIRSPQIATVDVVDETRKKMSISRSDFYETAVKLYLAELGVTKA